MPSNFFTKWFFWDNTRVYGVKAGITLVSSLPQFIQLFLSSGLNVNEQSQFPVIQLLGNMLGHAHQDNVCLLGSNKLCWILNFPNTWKSRLLWELFPIYFVGSISISHIVYNILSINFRKSTLCLCLQQQDCRPEAQFQ